MTFSRTLIVGCVPDGVLEGERRPMPPGMADEWGRVPVERAIEWARRAVPGTDPVLVVTDGDLTMRECQWLFGFADVEQAVAIVSTRRLAPRTDPARMRTRLENEIAHEAGHLRGLRHCRNPFCVMRPVNDPRELDTRPIADCGRCGSAWSPRARVVAAGLFLAAMVGGLNVLMPLLAGPRFEMPFT
jgi:archaemetzincin